MTTLTEGRRKLVHPVPDQPSAGQIMREAFTERVTVAPAESPSPRRPALLTALARALGTLAGILVGFARKGRTGILSVAGLTFGVLAAFDLGRVYGLAALAVAAFVLEWLMKE